MIETDTGLVATRDAAAHLEDALLDLHRNRAKYHPTTYALLAAPIVEELQVRRREIDDYVGVPLTEPHSPTEAQLAAAG
jgi:hypothetical protein